MSGVVDPITPVSSNISVPIGRLVETGVPVAVIPDSGSIGVLIGRVKGVLMADVQFNISKGRIVELVNRVNANDPANSALILVVLKAAGLVSDEIMRDYATLAAVLAGTSDEATNAGYARKVLTDASSITAVVDNTFDFCTVSFPNPVWTAPAAAGGAWGALLVCYDSDTTGGTDANIVPLTKHNFAFTPDGVHDATGVGASTGFFRAE